MYYVMKCAVLTLIILFVTVCSIDLIHKFMTVCLSFVFLPVDFLRNLFSSTLGLGSPEKVLDELSLEGVARYIKSGKCKSTCVCLKLSSSNYAHRELIYSNIESKCITVMQLLLIDLDIPLHPHR